MGAGVATAAAAVLAGGAPGARAPEIAAEVCELSHADRATTRAVRCMGCHDGSAAPGVAFRMRAGDTPGFDHPVDVDYASAAARDRRLRPRPDAGVVLVDGLISCTTCHDGRSREPFHVVVTRQELCISCHEM